MPSKIWYILTRSSHTATVEDVDDTLIGGANTHKEDFGRLITARPKSVDEEILRALRMIYTLDVVLPKIDDELIGGRKPCCFIFFRVAIYRLVWVRQLCVQLLSSGLTHIDTSQMLRNVDIDDGEAFSRSPVHVVL